MKKLLRYAITVMCALSGSIVFGMDFPEEINIDEAYEACKNNVRDESLVLQGSTSLKFQAAQKVTTKSNILELDEYVKLLQKHKYWFSDKVDYNACLHDAIRKHNHDLVPDLMRATDFFELSDLARRKVIWTAVKARNFSVLRTLMTLDKDEVINILSFGTNPFLMDLMKLAKISITGYRGYGYRKKLWDEWDESNRDIAEIIFEEKLKQLCLKPGKKRADYCLYLLRDNDFCAYNALMIAAHIGSLKYVQEFIKDFDVNHKTSSGITALYEAARSRNSKVIQFLIDNGANCEPVFQYFLNDKDVIKLLYQGLEKMCTTQEEYVSKSLISGRTLLFYAAMANLYDEAKLLIQCGASVNHKDSLGRTALFDAVMKNSKDTVKLLIESGADVNAIDNDYNVPLSICRDQSIRKLLIDNGARNDLGRKLKQVLNEVKKAGIRPWLDLSPLVVPMVIGLGYHGYNLSSRSFCDTIHA